MHPNGSSCLLAGKTLGNWTTTNAGDETGDFMAVNLDIDGHILWEWQNGTPSIDRVNAGGVDNDGSVILAGSTAGGYAAENAGSHDFVVIKLDDDGEVLWTWQDGTAFYDVWNGLAIGEDGSAVLAGRTEGNWSATSAGGSDWAAMKLDADGTVVWKWQDGSAGYDHLYGAALSDDGSVVLAGVTNDSVSNFVAVKLDADGTEIWNWQDGTDKDDECFAIAAAGNGSVVLAGITSGNWSGTNAGSSDFAAVKLDANGTEAWRWQVGHAVYLARRGWIQIAPIILEGTFSLDWILGAAAFSTGLVMLVGRTDGDFVGTNMGVDRGDFVAVELDTNGTVLWRWQNGTGKNDELHAVTTDKNGRFIMAGDTLGGWNGSSTENRDFAAVLFDASSTLSATPSPTSPSTAEPTGLPPTPSPTSFPSTAEPTRLPPTHFPTSPSTVEPTGLPPTPSPTSFPSTVGSTTFPSNVGLTGRSSSLATIAVVVAAVVAVTSALLAVCLWRRIARPNDDDRQRLRDMDARQGLRSPVVDLSESVILRTNGSYGSNVVGKSMEAPPAPPENALEQQKSAALAGREDSAKVVKMDGQEKVTVEGGAMLVTSTMATSIPSEALSTGPLPCEPPVDIIPETTISKSAVTNVAVSRNSTGSAFPGERGISAALAVMEAASAVASSSSIPGVSEAARLVSILVELVVDKEDNDATGDWRVRWCRSIVAVLERASGLIEECGDGIGQNAERYLLEDVYDSVSGLVGIMQAYSVKGKIWKLFMSTLFKRRQEEAEAVINRAIARLQLGLQVQTGHNLISVGRHVQDMKAERKTQEKSPEGSVKDFIKHELAESRRARRQRRLQQLEIPEDQLTLTDVLLGKGGFGEVYLADYSGVNAAAKVMHVDNYQSQDDLHGFDSGPDRDDRARQLELQGNQRRMFFQELQAMTRLRSPHTVQVFGAITSRKDRLVLVMELMPGGDLRALLWHAGERFSEVRERRIMKCICSGMEFLHNRGVIHGDLKSANVLFDSAGTAKIADFGTARWTQHVASTGLVTTVSTSKSNNAHMSIAWAAPEVLDNDRESFESDVYSFGVVAWEIVTRQTPWANLNPRTIIRRVLAGGRPEIPRETEADLTEIMCSCWHDNPRARPKFAEILDRMKA